MQQKNRILNFLPYVIVIVALISLFNMNSPSSTQSLNYNEFQEVLQKETIRESVLSIGSNISTVRGVYEQGEETVTFTATVPSNDAEISDILKELEDSKLTIVDAEASNVFMETLFSMIPFVMIMLMGIWMVNRMNGSGSANARAFEFGKSRAQLETKSKVRFTDVAGCDEEKQEMAEIIDYLKYPKKFQRMGARIPKGVLLCGHPGTGKTLLAKAVAGEANVPFYSISGSDFVEMFVGVGASRVRDMFKKAQQTAQALYSSMKSTRSAGREVPGSAAGMTNVNRP